MTVPIAVFSDLAAYRIAVAGLPLAARHTRDAAEAIVVVDGSGAWWEAATDAARAGAPAVLIAEPRDVPLAEAHALAHLSVPILVHRSRLRPDLVSMALEHRAGVQPRVVVAECRAASSELVPMVRDAAGWMRALAGATFVVACPAGRDGGTSLLRAGAEPRAVGSVIATVTRPEGSLLRVTALGEVTSEIEIDEPAGLSELSTSTREGRQVAPSRFEAGERVAVRRAVEAVRVGSLPTDLVDLIRDENIARTILQKEMPAALVAL